MISVEREVVQIKEPATSKPTVRSLTFMLLITLFQLITLLEACMFISPQRKTGNSAGSFLYSAFPDKIKRNYRFPTPGWN